MSSLEEKIKAIRLLILDVDGVLTDGSLYYGNNGIDLKKFHVHDGLGIQLLKKAKIEVAVISAKKSPLVALRLEDLKLQHVYLGQHKKILAYNELKEKLKLKDEEIAFMGDDLPDIPVLSQVGVSLTVSNSPILDLTKFDYICKTPAGFGAVREASELILKSQNKYQEAVNGYLNMVEANEL